MNAAIQAICFKISQHPEVRGSSVTRSQIYEVIAALLGYASHAALVTESKSQEHDYEFSDAEFIILNVPHGKLRAQKFSMSEDAFNCCITEIKAGLPIPVFESLSVCYDYHLRELLAGVIYDEAEQSGEMADSNAIYPDYPEMDDNIITSGDLWASVHEWTIEDTGTLTGEYDPEGDRIFNGNTLNVKGRLHFAKAGRAGLVHLSDEAEVSVSTDDSWRDYDLDF
ncbi:hypothetical protein [Pantoea eucrina]|uniref:hypothetical protein n=1 Tax=Pantoea eucrina TaxID=472693 RepID=UPI0028A25EFB|nr:hypothetical protein [Pantoea eucrina]